MLRTCVVLFVQMTLAVPGVAARPAEPDDLVIPRRVLRLGQEAIQIARAPKERQCSQFAEFLCAIAIVREAFRQNAHEWDAGRLCRQGVVHVVAEI